MANGHGGVREGAGRPKKADEEKISDFAIKAIIKRFGSEEEGFEFLAEEAKKGSFNHLRLLFEYAYGAPAKQKEEQKQPVVIQWEEIKMKKAE